MGNTVRDINIMNNSRYMSQRTGGILGLIICLIAIPAIIIYGIKSYINEPYDYIFISGTIAFIQIAIISFLKTDENEKLSFDFVYWLTFALVIISAIDLVFIGITIAIHHYHKEIQGVGLRDGLIFSTKDLIFFIIFGANLFTYTSKQKLNL